MVSWVATSRYSSISPQPNWSRPPARKSRIEEDESGVGKDIIEKAGRGLVIMEAAATHCHPRIRDGRPGPLGHAAARAQALTARSYSRAPWPPARDSRRRPRPAYCTHTPRAGVQ